MQQWKETECAREAKQLCRFQRDWLFIIQDSTSTYKSAMFSVTDALLFPIHLPVSDLSPLLEQLWFHT